MSVLNSLKTRLDEELAEDRAFLAKLKPELIKARIRGDLPTNEVPGRERTAPPGPQLSRQRARGGLNPWLVIGAALALGIGAAKIIDWRGHAHPRT
jgi:hypothetical protein